MDDRNSFPAVYFRHYERLREGMSGSSDPPAGDIEKVNEKLRQFDLNELVDDLRRVLPRARKSEVTPQSTEDDLVFTFYDRLLSGDELHDLWQTTLTLLDNAPNDHALAFVAAGPLETLLRNHGEEVIPWLETEYPRRSQLRKALTGVWLAADDAAIWARLMVLMENDPPEERLS